MRLLCVLVRKLRLGRKNAAASCDHIFRRDRAGKEPARHAAGRGRVEAAGGEKLPRRSFGDNRAVKEHRAPIGKARAELRVVAYHDDAYTALCQAPYDPGKRLFELRVKSLRRLVEEQHLGLPQKDLAKCRPLLLAAGKIVGVPV